MKEIDINCDMGESYGNFSVGNDKAIFPHITSTNIACGMHAGDPYHIQKTIEMAIAHGVQIGAHPGYPDLQGFGRRVVSMSAEELSASIKYQVAALKGMVESAGGQLKYVKPHGALYNEMAKNEKEAITVVKAIKSIDPSLLIMGLAGSHMKHIVEAEGMIFIGEAFADRRYEADGKLMSRAKENSVIHDAQAAVNQVLSVVNNGYTKTLNGEKVELKAQSFCIHGDNPQAVEILKAIKSGLEENGITQKAFTTP
ncbi:5-oxoprolinase subunit PxpA [Roseivirga sp.]|uniref:5-oxoprolinase subunit PxpA n=1 Tax=Roseivirga sp. TaxID=1964215 RepID=UPI002B267008|nr:5-oxoprolinase subunit PxpA [Roseivirga sp.]